MVDRALDLLTSREVQATLNISGLLGIVWGAVRLLRAYAQARIRSQERVELGRIRVTLADGTVLDVPAESQDLVRDLSFRRSMRTVVSPLERDGVDELVLSAQTGRVDHRPR